MVVVDSIHYGCKGPWVFYFEDLWLCILFLNFGLYVVGLQLMLMKVVLDFTFDILNDAFFIVQIQNERPLFDIDWPV
jgi:hypothetical protein